MVLPGFSAGACVGPTLQVYRVHNRYATVLPADVYPQQLDVEDLNEVFEDDGPEDEGLVADNLEDEGLEDEGLEDDDSEDEGLEDEDSEDEGLEDEDPGD